MNSRIAVVVLLVSSIGWGLTWLPLKALGEMGLHPLHLVLIVSLSASLVLMPWIIKQRTKWLPVLSLMALICLFGGISNVSFQTAILEGDVVRVMILFYMLPIWSVLGGRLILKELIDKQRLAALLLCVGGAFLILEAWQVAWTTFTWIDVLALAAGFGLAVNNILFRFTSTIPLASKVGFIFIGSIAVAGISLLILSVQAPLPSNGAVPLAMAYGVGWIMVTSFGTMWGVTCLGAGRGAVLIVMELVVAVLSVVIITQVELQLHEIIGCIMVIIAALLEGMRADDNGINNEEKKLGV